MPNGSKAQVLVVADESRTRETLGMLLMSAGYDVAASENGISAVSRLNRMVPDLILTDLNMPRMSGTEFISHVGSRYPSISIVAMSGDYQGDGVPAGIIADGLYTKGQRPNDLLTTTASLITTNPDCGNARSSHRRPVLDS